MNFSQIFPPDKDNEFSNRENKRNLPITTSIYIHYPYWNERENFLSTSMISQLKKKILGNIKAVSLFCIPECFLKNIRVLIVKHYVVWSDSENIKIQKIKYNEP